MGVRRREGGHVTVFLDAAGTMPLGGPVGYEPAAFGFV